MDHASTPRVNPWLQPKPLIYLAPMSGVTNTAYRQIVKQFASDIVFPEFVSVDAMHYEQDLNGRTWQMLEYDETERPIIAQVFGAKPELFYEAAKQVKQRGFDGIDINFGCPAPKVAKNGGGCALLGDLGLCKEIIQAVIDGVKDGDTLNFSVDFPVSVKTRISYKQTHVRDFCNVIADLPLSALCIHGRPFEKPYEGEANLECVKEAKTLVPFPVMASGHGHTPEAAKYTLDTTGADGIAVARGTFGKPWLIKQIKDYLATGSYTEPTQAEILDIMVQHATLAAENSARPFVELRKVLAWYVRGIPHAGQYRAQLVRVKDLVEVKSIVETIKKDLPDA